MKTEKELPEFDDVEAVKFIQKFVQKDNKKFTDEDIEYILDVIFDYCDSQGLIKEDSAEEAEIDEAAMLDFIMKTIKKEQIVKLTEEDVELILEGEFEYGKSIGIYKEME
ncbi:MAG: hypothetical protein LBR81_06010 [Prevotellaceae bacterium]|jgi:hypothetical protein|nr:hypothetical protein [Prevotellaceae bacterium]